MGSVYITVVNTNPSTWFGGTWSLLCPGRTLVCVDTSDSDFSTVKKTGGEKTHKLTIDEMPSHGHDMDDVTYGGNKNMLAIRGDGGGSKHLLPHYDMTTSYSIYLPTNTGGNQPHNNLQPYMTVYIWQRTA